ncbi:MAG TPA: hypothetical protein VFI14_00645 [Chryseosolibacter sp.]|nr:hypothetical protein [Chryseosolibacter sp.]
MLSYASAAQSLIQHNTDKKSVRIQDGNGNLVLDINYDGKLLISRLQVLGQTPVSNDDGIFSAVKINQKWFTTQAGIQTPEVTVTKDNVTISNIQFGEGSHPIRETWIIRPSLDYVAWIIQREYPGSMTIEDTGFPQWSFNDMGTWTGALLGTGGVAWCKLFNSVNASYGNHTGEVALWNQGNKSGLRITPLRVPGQYCAVRFSRQPDNKWTLNYTVSKSRVTTKSALTRFIKNRQDIWDTLKVGGTITAAYRLQAFDYDKEYYRGDFPGLNGEAIRSVLNTIARVGVIDENIVGSNNWHLSAGFAVLHEQWIAQMGLAINDPNYLENYQKALDYYRDNAISDDGRVKSRWAYVSGDHEPGTYDEKGFYEAQWGRLLDSNTDQVINVAALFQMNGDTGWVRTHKSQCEKVLEYLLRRDSDDDGLIEAMTDSYKEGKGSDWIDVIWASYENAFLNAKMYEALVQWADVERVLGDSARANGYLTRAGKLKDRFNESTANGGFWDPENGWYVYWRDKDNTIHGNNLVTPVNFMAIAYGICDDKTRQASILSAVENLMQKENLFMWPISFLPFESDEGLKVNYPFPNYENGDIFLGWGEVGIRAYQNYDVNIPLKYIRHVLEQYEKDGLVFQRYDRDEKVGRGDDILANNALPIVGLYRDIFGIQPKYNRLYLNPHLTKALDGTTLKYWLRGQNYTIHLSVGNYRMSAGKFSVSCSNDFAMQIENNGLLFFNAENPMPDLKISGDGNAGVVLDIIAWAGDNSSAKKWTITASGTPVTLKYEISGLMPNSAYTLLKNGKSFRQAKANALGKIVYTARAIKDVKEAYELKAR